MAAWREKAQRYSLIGQSCPECGKKMFPPRPICPECLPHALVQTFVLKPQTETLPIKAEIAAK